MNEYANGAELKATLELTGETFADPDITLALTAASRAIDNVCDRRFYADADATQVRYYSPDDARILRIDDLVTLTTLVTDPGGDGTFEDAWTLNTDFVLEPLNAAANAHPYTTIAVHPNGSFRLPCSFPRSVKLTGKFGWSAVPEPIKEATMVLASKLMRRAREAPFGVVSVGLEAGAAMRIARNDPDVLMLVGPYRRYPVAVA
jgi:hypothetical protein